MIWTDDYHRMACKVLIEKKMVPPEDHLGLAYDCFVSDMHAYDPEKCVNPVTYFAHRLGERIQRERRYGSIVHVPVVKQDTTDVAIFSLYAPLSNSDGTTTLGEMIEGSVDPENDLEYGELVAKLSKGLSEKEQNLFRRFIVGEENQTEYAKSIGTSKQMVHRDIALLREKLKFRLDYLEK